MQVKVSKWDLDGRKLLFKSQEVLIGAPSSHKIGVSDLQEKI